MGIGPGHQPLAVPVLHPAQTGAHQGGKAVVDAPDDPRRAAEVGIQRQPGGPALIQRHKGGQLVQKHLGIRLAEPVDALFQIAHKEQVAPVRFGQTVVERVLQGVGVLVFVHHDHIEPGADRFGQRGAGAVLVLQKPQSQVFKVGKVQGLFLYPGGKEGLFKIRGGPQQRGHQRGSPAAVLLKFGGGAEKQIPGQPLHDRFGLLAQSLDLVGFQAGGIFDRGQPGLGKARRQADGAVPVPGGEGALQALHPLQILFQGGGVFVQRSGQFFGHRQGGPDQAQGLAAGAGGLVQQHRRPAGGGKGGVAGPFPAQLIQRLAEMGQGAGKIVDGQYRRARRPVGAAAAVQVGKSAEIRILVGSLQRFVQRGGPQRQQVGFVGGGEVRRDVQLMEVAAQQLQTEGVDGADSGLLQQQALAAQTQRTGVGHQAGGERIPDAAPQLGSGGIGKGDDQQPVGADRLVRVAEHPHHPFHQHGGFAAAGGGADQQGPAPGFNGPALGACPVDAHSSLTSSNTLSGACTGTSRRPSSWPQTAR